MSAPDAIPEARMVRARSFDLFSASDGVVLKRGRTETIVNGQDAEVVVRTLQQAMNGGAKPLTELLRLFPSEIKFNVEQLIQHLSKRGFLEMQSDTSSVEAEQETDTDIFYWHFGETAGSVVKRLQKATFEVIGVSNTTFKLVSALVGSGANRLRVVDAPELRGPTFRDLSAETIERKFGLHGVTVVAPEDWKSALPQSETHCVIGVAEAGGQNLLRYWNELCVREKLRFYPIVLHDLVGSLGPLIIPNETPCLECVRARQNAAMADPELERLTEAAAGHAATASSSHPAMGEILAGIAALELSMQFGCAYPLRTNEIVEVNFLRPSVTPRRVLRIPRCRVCCSLNTASSMTTHITPVIPGTRYAR